MKFLNVSPNDRLFYRCFGWARNVAGVKAFKSSLMENLRCSIFSSFSEYFLFRIICLRVSVPHFLFPSWFNSVEGVSLKVIRFPVIFCFFPFFEEVHGWLLLFSAFRKSEYMCCI